MADPKPANNMPEGTFIEVDDLDNASYKLIIHSIDFELRLFELSQDVEVFSVNENTLEDVRQDNSFPTLKIRRNYLIRYNNNNGGSGNLNLDIVQIINKEITKVAQSFNLNSIDGPQVIEIPFQLVKLKQALNRPV